MASIVNPLPSGALYRACDDALPAFETTAELPGTEGIFGQERAEEAIGFALDMKQPGYNLFVLSEPGSGSHSMVQVFIEARAREEAGSSDWCYVNSFNHPDKPIALCLPAGLGSQFQRTMRQLARELVPAINDAFDSHSVSSQIEALRDDQKQREEKAVHDLSQSAADRGAVLVRTSGGFVFSPAKDGEAMSDEAFSQLPEDEQERLVRLMENFRDQLGKLLHQFPHWRREMWGRMKQVGRDAISLAVGHLMEDLKTSYRDQPKVIQFLDGILEEAIEHGNELLKTEQGKDNSDWSDFILRCHVNLLVEHGETKGAPVVFEDNPTYQNLVGRFDQIFHMGPLVTDVTLIKAGALHRANGGYLMLDAVKILSQPYAWEGLKVALKTARIRIEPLGQAIGWASTVPMEPEPIPLNVKVVLFGERDLYDLLKDWDPEFSELFKVVTDFEDDMVRDETNIRRYAGFLAGQARSQGLRPLDRHAVARVVEHSSRLAGDGEKLSALTQPMTDLLREADHWATRAGCDHVRREDVDVALREQIRRAERLRRKCHEAILRGTVLIDTDGEVVAQVNGLAVVDEPSFLFAHPVRVTATARMGEGEVIDIERESELGGAIHSKGVMILSAFLANRYSRPLPLSLSASLVFEQSYGPVEGDSASLAELCALLSALSGVPIKQSLAATGSVNQHGQVQTIGAVNEKIEGFFDICSGRGLTGEQGVLIPAANVKHLMLREDVVAAAAEGKFHVYAVDTVDQAIELLTGVAVGEPDAEGLVPAGSINFLVANQLAEWAELRQAYGQTTKGRQKRKEA
jgi:lon-related putative ATP-dependent protease